MAMDAGTGGMEEVHPPPAPHPVQRTIQKKHACRWAGCGKSFAWSGNRTVHERSHTGERPFACNHDGCVARFVTKGQLTDHERTHTGERPFACNHDGCDARFAARGNLAKHAQAAHTAKGLERKKEKEDRLAGFLTSANLTYRREATIRFDSQQPGPRYARADFRINQSWGTDLVECDEGQHKDRDPDDEAQRMLKVFAELTRLGDEAGKVRFIRFNPDAYAVGGRRRKTSQQDQQAALLRTIRTEPTLQHSVAYLFYDRAGPLPDVCLDAAYPNLLRAIASVAD